MNALNIMSVLMVGIITLAWAIRGKGRGFFSAFINLVCVVAAGAIAFSAWESVSYLLLPYIEDMAFGLGLILPFAAALVALRAAIDLTVSKNLNFDDVTNAVGGLVCGAGAGILTAGVVVTGLNYVRFGPELLGAKLLKDQRGSLVYESPLWVPVDQWTVKFYEQLSLNGFASDDALATRLPDAHVQGALARSSYTTESEGRSVSARIGAQPDQVAVKGRYSIPAGVAINDLLADTNILSGGKPFPQEYVFPDGTKPGAGASLHGFIVQFTSGAGEGGTGQVIIGPGQVRLIARRGEESRVITPIAIVATPEAASLGMYRFRMDAPNTFVPSVGGKSETLFGFEFIVPADFRPTDLMVRNLRFELAKLTLTAQPPAYATIAARDRAIKDGSMLKAFGLKGAGVADAPDRSAVAGTINSAASSGQEGDILATGELPWEITLNKGDLGGMSVNDKNELADGSHAWPTEQLKKNRGIDRNLKVSNFAATGDTAVVQVRLASQRALSVLGGALQTAESVLPITLVDDQNRRYEAIGYIVQNSTNTEIRFTPGQPLRGLTEVPGGVSRTNPGELVRLLFRPTKGVKIVGVLVGNKMVTSISPPLSIN
ncbi:MAG: hypothetical protein IBJ11_05880 [Phycisphaerales bacterium]|nr:hypothetical protein [Phycisphaerales bacterium]